MRTSIVQNEDSTDSDMPAMLCGWCNGKDCNGIHLSYCRTWQNVSAQLNLDTPRCYRLVSVKALVDEVGGVDTLDTSPAFGEAARRIAPQR